MERAEQGDRSATKDRSSSRTGEEKKLSIRCPAIYEAAAKAQRTRGKTASSS